MAQVGQSFTSGNWIVKAGKESEFVASWTSFVEWSMSELGADAFDEPVLIRNANEPRHFISFGGWRDAEMVARWRAHPEFGERLGRCRELCEEFRAGDYTVAAAPKP